MCMLKHSVHINIKGRHQWFSLQSWLSVVACSSPVCWLIQTGPWWMCREQTGWLSVDLDQQLQVELPELSRKYILRWAFFMMESMLDVHFRSCRLWIPETWRFPQQTQCCWGSWVGTMKPTLGLTDKLKTYLTDTFHTWSTFCWWYFSKVFNAGILLVVEYFHSVVLVLLLQ